MNTEAKERPMNCQEARELLPRQIDRRLAGDEQALLGSHLDACADCAAEQAGQARTDALLAAALGDHPFGGEAVERILLALPTSAPATHTSRGGPAAWITAAAAVLLGAVLVFGDRAPTTDGPGQAPRAVAQASDAGWMRLDGETSEELETGAPIHAGDRLVALITPAVLTLDDGTQVDVHADTELSLREDADGGLAVVMESDGRLFCRVAKRSAPFRVASRQLTVEVLGTRFAVDQEVGVSRVIVVEGRVEAMGPGDRRVLTADQGAELRLGLSQLELLQVTAKDWVRWLPALQAEPAPQPEPTARPQPPVQANPTPRPQPTARPSPTDPSLDTPILPPGRDGPPGGN